MRRRDSLRRRFDASQPCVVLAQREADDSPEYDRPDRDPVPRREAPGPLRLRLAGSPVVVASQAEALAAVSVAVGQRGRADRPEARRVASELAGRTRCPADAREREVATGAHFVRQELEKVWPARTTLPAVPAGDSFKIAAKAAVGWVARVVAARDVRVEAALAAMPSGSASRSAAGPATAAPVPVRPSAARDDPSSPAVADSLRR